MFAGRRVRSKIILHAYTAVAGLVESVPPVRLMRELPEWWQNLPPFVERIATKPEAAPAELMSAKHCYALQEIFKRGIGLRLWSDVTVVVNGDGKVSASRPHTGNVGSAHPDAQHDGAIASNGRHYKLHSPWAFVCEQPLHFFWTHPFYHQSDSFRFHAMPGIVEYRHQHSTNVNIVVPYSRARRSELSLVAGEFLVYIVPMTEEPVDLVCEQVSDSDMQRINFAEALSNRPIFFRRKYSSKPFIVGR